mgnify:CR=1 FL=1
MKNIKDYTYPILYTFRRCPYAIRARMVLAYTGTKVEIREISLRNRPTELYSISPKGTVPVLYFNDETVIDESVDIIIWALSQSDPDSWLSKDRSAQLEIVHENDGVWASNRASANAKLEQLVKKKQDLQAELKSEVNGTYPLALAPKSIQALLVQLKSDQKIKQLCRISKKEKEEQILPLFFEWSI